MEGTPCPHCAKPITHLSGFMTQTTLEDRIKTVNDAKGSEITALKAALSTSQAQAQGHTALVAERDQLLSWKTSRKTRDVRVTAMTEAGADAKLLQHFETLYNSATAGVDGAKTFETWLGEDAKAHPLLAGQFGGTPAPAADGATPTPTTTTTPPIAVPTPAQADNGRPAPANHMHVLAALTADPAAPGDQRFTKADMKAWWDSPEYKAKSPADKKTDDARLETISKSWGHPDHRGSGRL